MIVITIFMIVMIVMMIHDHDHDDDHDVDDDYDDDDEVKDAGNHLSQILVVKFWWLKIKCHYGNDDSNDQPIMNMVNILHDAANLSL